MRLRARGADTRIWPRTRFQTPHPAAQRAPDTYRRMQGGGNTGVYMAQAAGMAHGSDPLN